MSRDFSKVSPKVWRSTRFRSLPDGDARLFYLFMLTCEHQSSAGCFRLPDAYAAADLGWEAVQLDKARAALIAAELLVHDAASEEYFVPRWFKHNPGTNPKHRAGIVRLISELDSDHVREAAETEYENSLGQNPLDSPPATSRYGGGIADTPFLRGNHR